MILSIKQESRKEEKSSSNRKTVAFSNGAKGAQTGRAAIQRDAYHGHEKGDHRSPLMLFVGDLTCFQHTDARDKTK